MTPITFHPGDRVLTRCGSGTVEYINSHGEPVVRGDGGEDFTFYGTFAPEQIQLIEREVQAA